jgi:hypothetical protein
MERRVAISLVSGGGSLFVLGTGRAGEFPWIVIRKLVEELYSIDS